MIGKKLFFIGQGHRSDPATAQAIADASGYFVLPIQLLQAQFYHLDCCFLPLPNDAAVIYEGEYSLDESGEMHMDDQGWPIIMSGSETMTSTSRALIRSIYPPEKLVLISKDEALAFATNAVVLQNPLTNKFKLFVNGKRDEICDESIALKAQIISLTRAHMQHIEAVTGGEMDIVEVPYSTMHGSGGSIRCSVLELACSTKALTPQRSNPWHFEETISLLESKLYQTNAYQFFKKSVVCKDDAAVNYGPGSTRDFKKT